MTDAYSTNPDQGFDPVTYILGQQRAATGAALDGLDANPDDAARAQKLSEATGVHPALVDGDLEHFEAQHKAALTAQLLNSNAYLRDYIAKNPLGAKVSNDDYGQLDKVSDVLTKHIEGYMSEAIKGFKEGIGTGHLHDYITPEEEEKYPAAVQTLTGITDPIEAGMRLLSGLSMGAGYAIAHGFKQAGSEAGGEAVKSMAQAAMDPGFWASMGPLGEMVGLPFEVAAHNAKMAEGARAAAPFIDEGKVPPVGLHPEIDKLHVDQAKVDAKGLAEVLKESVKSSTRERSPDLFASYINQIAGDSEIGIQADAVRKLYGGDPEVDAQITELTAKLDKLRSINNKFDASRRAQLPSAEEGESTAQFNARIQQHPDYIKAQEERSKEIAEETDLADQINALHEKRVGKAPTPDDNILGFIPDLGDKLASAEATGGDVRVPLADYLAKVEPEVHKELQDFIRARPEGLTVEEGKELEPGEPVTPSGNDAVDGLRQSAGLEPPKPVLLEGEDTTGAKQLELPQAGTTRMEDREAFEKGAAIGLNADEYKRYTKLIEKRLEEDRAAGESRAAAEQRKKLTPEWKAKRGEMRASVKEEFESRPDVELLSALDEGRVKLSREGLTDEQIAALPKDFVSADGIHPDDLAGLYGDSSPSGLVDRVAALAQAREASGLKPGAFHGRMIDAETDRRLEAGLQQNILEEAKDQVLSETQEQLLHETTLARATEAGLEYSISQGELKASIKANFDRALVREVSSDKSLAEAGRASRAERLALLKGDAQEAFRQAQRHYNAIVEANYAKKFEKGPLKKIDKFADTYKARTLKAVEQEYTNWVRDILTRVGKPVIRNLRDHQELIDAEQQKTLEDFVDYKLHHDLREVQVADFLQDPNYRKNTESMTTKEFSDVSDSLTSLDHNGRNEKKMIVGGDAIDAAEVHEKLLASLDRFDPKAYDMETGERAQAFAKTRRVIRSAVVSHLQIETLLDNLDRYNNKGPWNQYFFRGLVEAANSESRLDREIGRKLNEVADTADLKDRIPNTIFTDPWSSYEDMEIAAPTSMTRKGLRTVMLNMGNESNFNKLAAGYFDPTARLIRQGLDSKNAIAVTEALDKEMRKEQFVSFKGAIKAWVDQHATKEDWDWTQKIWDILEDLHQQSNNMYRELSGVAPEGLVINPIQTKFGEYKGGYYPLIRHPLYAEEPKFGKDFLEGQGFTRAFTLAGYTKERTGAIYPLSLNLDEMPNKIRQIIHDISFRPAVVQASKLVYNKALMAKMKSRLGAEYANMFQPYLKDVVNSQNFTVDKNMATLYKLSEFLRQNVAPTMIGLNPSTVLKHTPTALASTLAEVSPMEFIEGLHSLLTVNEETGEANYKFMRGRSDEMYRRSRNWVETIGGGHSAIEGRAGVGKALAQGEYGGAVMSLRDTLTNLYSKPVALGDFLSSGPLWMGRYKREMEEHGVVGDAVYAADKAVRRAHGSSAITSKSSVARNRSLQWFTQFFTYMNDLLNRQIETVWRAGEINGLVKDGQKDKAMAEAGNVIRRTILYAIVPALIEEMVTPLTNKEHESWAWKAGKAMLYTGSSSWIFARDIVGGILNARDPSVGLLSTLFKTGGDTVRDLKAPHIKSGNIIRHGSQLAGLLTGLVPAQAGRTAEFLTGKERPKGPWGWLVGARYGTLENHSQTLEQWWKGK